MRAFARVLLINETVWRHTLTFWSTVISRKSPQIFLFRYLNVLFETKKTVTSLKNISLRKLSSTAVCNSYPAFSSLKQNGLAAIIPAIHIFMVDFTMILFDPVV